MTRLSVLFLFAFLWVFAVEGAEGVIWAEAERFDQRGGWEEDRQFVDVMGSPYLMAQAIGRPVADASTTVEVPAKGTYRLWVRCRDWLPEHSPGVFQVFVDGRASAVRFGKAKDDEWRWVDGGEFELAGDKATLLLHDLSGWWGRCDAIVLSQSVRPSDDPDELADQRIQYGAWSEEVEAKGPYDVVVVGGGLAGCSAAVAAARHGCSVALVQDRPMLGGNASSEIGVAISGDTSREPWDPKETGIIEELAPPVGGKGRSAQFEAVVRGQAGVDLFLGTRATGVDLATKGVIGAVLARELATGKRLRLPGRYFVDCTGDGWVGFWAGAEFRRGREGRGQFDEPGAPEKADAYSLSTSLTHAKLVTHERPAAFVPPEWAYHWEACSDFDQLPKETVHSRGDLPPEGWYDMVRGEGRHPGRTGDALGAWWLEYGGVRDTIGDAERIRDELFRIKLGLWDHVKSHCPKLKAENRNRELVWSSHLASKRESRRLVGDYTLSQQDYIQRKEHADAVFYAGYNIDPHNPMGFWTKGAQAFRLYHYKVSVPYRILYSRNIENLFMAGRNVSATHLAFNGVRVMRITCSMGQVVGTAAGVAKAHDTTPRGVYQHHIAELQQALLRDGCYIMGIPNRDPEDLALHATVTASSTGGDRADAPGSEPHGGTFHMLVADRAAMFTARDTALHGVELYLRSEAETPVELTATLCAAPNLKGFAEGQKLCEAKTTVPPGHKGWVSFPLEHDLEVGKTYYVWIPATPGVGWELYNAAIPGTARAFRKGDWHPMSHCYKIRLAPGGEPMDLARAAGVELGPANVNNGWNRAVSGKPNAWSPDVTTPGPHWLQLSFPDVVRIGEVHVTFQTHRMAARSYDLAVPDGDGWRVVVQVRGNQLRRCVSSLDGVETKELRLIFREPAKADTQIRVCEVRAYAP